MEIWKKKLKRGAIVLVLVLVLVLPVVLVAFLFPDNSNVGNGTTDGNAADDRTESGLCAMDVTFKAPSYCDPTPKHRYPSPMCTVEKILRDQECYSRNAVINRPMTIFGLLLVLHYHVVPFIVYYSEGGLQKWLIWIFGRTYKYNLARLLGRNMVIINIYHSEHFKKSWVAENPFMASFLFVFADAFLLHRVCRYLQRKEEHKFGIIDNYQQGKVVQSQFSDFSVRFGFASAVFVSQLSLFILFVLQMNDSAESRKISSFKFLHWLIAVLVTNVAGNEECGGTFMWGVWRELWNIGIDYHFEQRDGVPVIKMADYKTEWRFRLVYDAIINGFFREVLLSFAPVALSSSSRSNLIKDVLAIFFIAKMDDIDDPKTIRQSLKDWEEQELDLDAARDSMEGTETANLGIHSSVSRFLCCCNPNAAADVEAQGETADSRREGESDAQRKLLEKPDRAEAEPFGQDQKPGLSLEERLRLSLQEAPSSTGALLEALVGEVRELRELKLKAA